jgi:hypothetical protein
MLDRLLEGLERELIDVPDEEIVEAAESLGMNLNAKGSAAFFGLRGPAKPELSDFFGFDFDARPPLPRKEPDEE